MGALTIIGSLILGYQNAAELLNFGAFLAFMGVNLAAFRRFALRAEKGESRNVIINAVFPLLGFVVCLVIWMSLPLTAKVMGGIWLSAGIIYLAIRTKGFKNSPVHIEIP
jgi:hypothetical protein